MRNDDREIVQGQQGGRITRRDWLLNLGSAVILSGFSGAPGESQQTDHAAAGALPPGLYTPSIDHVTQALNSDGPFFPIPPGAETEFVRPRTGGFVAQAFTEEEFRVIRRLVEIILGENPKNNPSQRSTGAPDTIYDEVAEWIDLVVFTAPRVRAAAHNLTPEQRALAVAYFSSEEPVREWETYEPDKVCREGLAWLQQESQSRSEQSFLDLVPAAELELVASCSDKRPDLSQTHPGTRFFDFLKAESARGFYTSRLGLNELNYAGNSFFGESPGCQHQSSAKRSSD
jgi:hypothetical protein